MGHRKFNPGLNPGFVRCLSIFWFAKKILAMSVLIIKGSERNQKFILALAKKIGSQAMSVKNEQMEDLLLGMMMEKEKTNTLVSKEEVLRTLRRS